MRRYETFVIIDPDISEEQRDSVIERIEDLISKENGLLVRNDVWGMRKLAYEIKKKPRGFYLRIDFCGTGALVDEMERSFRIDDRVMKYMTVLIDREADLEKIKEEMARAAEEQQQPESPAEASDEGAPPSDSVELETKTETEAGAEVDAKAETEVEAEAEVAADADAEAEAEVADKAETEAEATETEKAKEE